MNSSRRSGFWLACLMFGAALGAVAARWIQADLPPAKTIIKSPQDLSSAFRVVSETAIPAIVSIETKTHGRMIEEGADSSGEDQPDSPDNSPFGDDPIFREFFGNRGRSGRRQMQIPPQRGAGSGFVIDASGIIVTNAHVIDGADEVIVRFTDGTEIKADKWMGDSVTDVAIVKLTPSKPLTAVNFGDSDAMQVGDWVLALGNPFDLGTTVTAGIISATERKGLGINGREHFLQTDAAINPGNSGGALVNMNGEVVGINSAISTRSGGYDGVGFAIPANQARKIVDQLRKEGTVHRAFIGVTLDDLKPAVKKALGITSGVSVMEVLPDSPAAKAGILSGDVIVSFDGKPVQERSTLQEYVELLETGKNFDMEILRDGQTLPLKIMLEQRSSDSYAQVESKPESAEKPEKLIPKLGFRAKTLTPEVAQELGLPGATGVVIVGVNPGSLATQAGLQEGDVITKVGQTKVESLDAFQKSVGAAKLEDGVLLQVRRGPTTRFVLLQSE